MDTCILGIGTRSFELVHARVASGGRLESTRLASQGVGIEASVSGAGSIGSRAWTDAIRVAGKLIQRARQVRPGGHLVAVAPHALGGAENAEDFARAMRRKLGVPVGIVSVADTVQLAYRAACDEVDAGADGVAVIHVGDATIDFAAGSGPLCELAESVALGVVRLHHAYGATDSGLLAADAGALFSLMRLCGGPACRKLRQWGDVTPVFASENVLALRELAWDWGYLDRESATMERLALHAMVPEILEASPDQLGVDPTRASLVGTTAVVIDALTDLLGLRDVPLASHGVLEGAALEVLASAVSRLGATGTESRAGRA